jgi:hypothetical protein
MAVEFDQQPARIKTATRREFPQRRRGAYLPRVAVDKNAQALLHCF